MRPFVDRKPDFDRLLLTLKRGTPDAVPFYELFADHEVVEHVLGRRLPLVHPKRSEKETYLRGLFEFYPLIGFDYVPLAMPLNLQRDNVLQAPDPAMLPREARQWNDENQGVIETREDFGKYPWPSEEGISDWEYLDIADKLLHGNIKVIAGASGIFENVSWIMGLKPLSVLLYRDRDLVNDMFERVGQLLLHFYAVLAERDCVGAIVLGDDMGYKGGTLINPEFMTELVLPWQRRLADAAHRQGKPFILHSCGNLEAIMEGLISYVRIDAKHSFEDEIMPVWVAKEKYGKRIALLGGVDMDKLCRFSVSNLREYVRFILGKCASDGGYALGAGNTVANYVPLENYFAMLDEGVKFRML